MNAKLLLSLLGLWLGASLASAQSTAFTYQGHLSDGGGPANGPYNMTFRFFTAASGGVTTGPLVTTNCVPVNGGDFVVTLDFGSAPFTGQTLWLQITAGSCLGAPPPPPVTLTPRQELAPVPYAMFAGTAHALGTNGTLIGTPTFNNSSGAPFVVNSTTKVNNLNADLLDGLDSSAFWQLGGNAGTSPGVNYIGASDGAQVRLHATGGFLVDNTTPSLSFGATRRQMLNLYNADFGFGVQDFTLYSRGSGFAWHNGGVHANNQNDPGAGGTNLMKLDSAGHLQVNAGVSVDIANANDGGYYPGLIFGPGSGESIASNRNPNDTTKRWGWVRSKKAKEWCSCWSHCNSPSRKHGETRLDLEGSYDGEKTEFKAGHPREMDRVVADGMGAFGSLGSSWWRDLGATESTGSDPSGRRWRYALAFRWHGLGRKPDSRPAYGVSA